MEDLDLEAIHSIQLNDEAINAAVYAAGDAFHAGLDPHEQLRAGIQAYIWKLEEMAREFEEMRYVPS
jgi:hypothetical protein